MTTRSTTLDHISRHRHTIGRLFFDHLLDSADRCRLPDDALLRRQAIYLLGVDDCAESADWLASELTRSRPATTTPRARCVFARRPSRWQPREIETRCAPT